MARSRAEIVQLDWRPGEVVARIRSDIDQRLVLKCGQAWTSFETSGAHDVPASAGSQEVTVALKAGETIEVRFR